MSILFLHVTVHIFLCVKFSMNEGDDQINRQVNIKITLIWFYYDNMPMQYTSIVTAVKHEHFQLKNINIFLVFAQK